MEINALLYVKQKMTITTAQYKAKMSSLFGCIANIEQCDKTKPKMCNKYTQLMDAYTHLAILHIFERSVAMYNKQ